MMKNKNIVIIRRDWGLSSLHFIPSYHNCYCNNNKNNNSYGYNSYCNNKK